MTLNLVLPIHPVTLIVSSWMTDLSPVVRVLAGVDRKPGPTLGLTRQRNLEGSRGVTQYDCE